MTKTFLRRYTDLPALIYLLSERKLTLLDPKSWDDQNDAYYLELYREKKRLSSVLALCFTQASETYQGTGGLSLDADRKHRVEEAG